MTEKQKYQSIKVKTEVYDQIRFLSDKSGLNKGQLLSEIIGAIFDICVTFEDLNLTYEFDTDKVTIVVSGKNNLICGCQKMPKEVLAEEAKAGQLVKDISEYRPKSKVNEK